jgi:hypothetical protein
MCPPEVFVRSLLHQEAVKLKRMSTRAVLSDTLGGDGGAVSDTLGGDGSSRAGWPAT